MDTRLTDHINLEALTGLFQYQQEAPLLFTSGAFLILFIAFYSFYILVADQQRLRTIWVICFSLFFYYKCSGFYFVLLIFSTGIDFASGYMIAYSAHKGWRRFYLMVSIGTNLGLLAYFKYTNFFLSTWSDLMANPYDPVAIFLPVGISFYTFQTMSYTIDIYRRKIEPVDSVLDFAFFVSFFPQLVAGPIVRAADFLPQIRRKLRVTEAELGMAFWLICGGLFKKAVISDYIGVNFVDRVFENPMAYDGSVNLLGVYGYALQIYCDFSGYSDMAIGLGLLMGFRLPENFRSPYKSSSIQEFWRRWHISLSSWLRDYLYISMGGNRKGKLRTYLHLMLTMLLGGLWHGANWKFVVWGGMHGAMLAIERLFKEIRKGTTRKEKRSKAYQQPSLLGQYVVVETIPAQPVREKKEEPPIRSPLSFSRILGILFTFHFVCLCWIYFRAESFDMANAMILRIVQVFDLKQAGDFVFNPLNIKIFLLIALGYFLHFLPEKWDRLVQERFTRTSLTMKAAILAFFFWLTVQVRFEDVVPFIYFQF
ncbi:MAG: MBOAT family O-acyltransferase [Bacteroidota bacterium]